MANFNSDLVVLASLARDNKVNGVEVEGRVRVTKNATASQSTGADGALDFAQNDTFTMRSALANTAILGFLVRTDALGASVTIDIGDGSDDNRFADGIDVSAATTVFVPCLDSAELTADTSLIATLKDANPASGAFEITVMYAGT